MKRFGKQKIMKSTEGESPLKSPRKIRKKEAENLGEENPSKSRKSENIFLQERLVDLQEVQMKVRKEVQRK